MVRACIVFLMMIPALGLGFMPMGNVSTSLGGSGVALRNSAWGLYYNPALLSSDSRSKFSFNLGFSIFNQNVNSLLEIGLLTPTNEALEALSNLQDAQIRLSIQMGVVAQIGGFVREKTSLVVDEYERVLTQSQEERMSAFAIGAFATSQSSLFFSNGGGTNYKVDRLDVALMEIPIGYAYRLQTSFGDFNFGGALKYMRVAFDTSSTKNSVFNEMNLDIPNFLRIKPLQNFGIDLGFLYSIADFHLGLSAKNINLPTFKINGKKIILNPALRLGTSYEFLKNYALTMDIDLLPQTFSEFVPKQQFLGLGIMGDYRFIDFRFGFGMDILNPKDSKVTAGLNVFGVLDIVGEMGFNFAKIRGSELALPTNFGVKLGSTFTF